MSVPHSVYEKIKKCFALAQSDNPHEAAAALRQAGSLMRKHGLSERDVAASEITSKPAAKGGKVVTPPVWQAALAAAVGDALGCVPRYSSHRFGMSRNNHFSFYGRGQAPELACYAFDVLFRQLEAARKNFLANACANVVRRGRKTALADTFCLGWVVQVQQQLGDFGRDEADAIDGHLREDQEPGDLKLRDRAGKKPSAAEIQSFHIGREAGEKARLHRAMEGGVQPKAIGRDKD